MGCKPPSHSPPERSVLQLFFAAFRQAVRSWTALDKGSLKMQFQQDGLKHEQITALKKFSTTIIFLLERTFSTSRRIDNCSSAQFHEPYAVGQISISWAETCTSSRSPSRPIKSSVSVRMSNVRSLVVPSLRAAKLSRWSGLFAMQKNRAIQEKLSHKIEVERGSA